MTKIRIKKNLIAKFFIYCRKRQPWRGSNDTSVRGNFACCYQKKFTSRVFPKISRMLPTFAKTLRFFTKMRKKNVAYFTKMVKKCRVFCQNAQKNVAYFAKMLTKMRFLPKCAKTCRVFYQNGQKNVAYFAKMLKKMSRILPKCSKKMFKKMSRIFLDQKKCPKYTRHFFRNFFATCRKRRGPGRAHKFWKTPKSKTAKMIKKNTHKKKFKTWIFFIYCRERQP